MNDRKRFDLWSPGSHPALPGPWMSQMDLLVEEVCPWLALPHAGSVMGCVREELRATPVSGSFCVLDGWLTGIASSVGPPVPRGKERQSASRAPEHPTAVHLAGRPSDRRRDPHAAPGAFSFTSSHVSFLPPSSEAPCQLHKDRETACWLSMSQDCLALSGQCACLSPVTRAS